MGGKTRRRQTEAADRQSAIAETLRARQFSKKRKNRDVDPESLLDEEMLARRHLWIRAPGDWTPKTRTKDPARKKIEMLRHLFARYPVPRFLELDWFRTYDEVEEEENEYSPWRHIKRDLSHHRQTGISGIERFDRFHDWYVAAAQGRSLYRTLAKGFLTKRQTHYFLKAPDHFDATAAAWWAKAMSASRGDVGVAERIARSPIGAVDVLNPAENAFWSSAVEFFSRNRTDIHVLSDLTDYIRAIREEKPGWSFRKRSLASLIRRSAEWHRYIARQKTYAHTTWAGMDLPDWEVTLGGNDPASRRVYRFQQILTGKDLAAEGRAMRHSVSIYHDPCQQSLTSIWSMTVTTNRNGFPETKRALTVQLDRTGLVRQSRGFGNRLARPDEVAALKEWCRTFKLIRRDELLEELRE